jgi:hypothetical protein
LKERSMKARFATILSTVALATLVAPVTAQDELTVPQVTTIPNAAFCALLGQDVASCEGVLTGLAAARMVPEAFAGLVGGLPVVGFPVVGFPLPLPLPVAGPTIEGDVGDVLSRGDARVRLARVNRTPDLSDALIEPAEGNTFVSAFVRYRALGLGARYSVLDWVATDESGARYPATPVAAVAPALVVGVLPAGGVAKGWVTFEVPRTAKALRFIESQVGLPGLAWSIHR